MSNYSNLLSLINGAPRTVNFANSSNTFELANIQFDGSTSGHVVINASATTSTYSLIWPAAQAASSGYVLSNDGTGVLSWIPAASGSVTAISVNSSNGFAGTSSGGATPALTLSTTVTGILYGNGTSMSAAVAGNFPTLNQNTTGTAANVTATSNATLTTLSALTTASSLASVGTITSGTWNGTTIAIANGGTGQTSASSAFAALSPMTTAGDIIYENATPAPARLAIGSTGQVLTVSGGLPVWAAPATDGTVTSVAFSDASTTPIYNISGSPVTSSGTLTQTLTTQTANTVFAGPTTGSAAQPTFRSLVSADIPSLSAIYLALAGGTMSGAINMGGFKIDSLGSPTASSDAATKGYVDAAIAGLTWQGPAQAYAASNVPLTGSTPLVIDGYTVLNGDLLILANQTTASQNGEYSVAISGGSYTLTANGLPTVVGDAWLITHGTVYANSAFVATAVVPAATFIEFAGPTSYSFTSPLMLSGNTVSITQSTTSTNGYLSSTDWNTFNNKQAAGNYITALTGDITASGPGSAAATLATVNSNVGSFGSSTAIPNFTVNGKGLITAAGTSAVVAPAGTLSGTTLNSTVVSSSLTSVGTLTSGVWNATAVGPTFGGTGQTAYGTGDILYASATNTLSRLGIGGAGQVLTVVGGVPAWAATAVSPNEIALTQNHIMVGNASNQAADVPMSGDVAIVASGATTIQSGAVTASKLGTVTDGVTLDQSGAGSTLEIKSAGVSATQLATGAFDQVTITGGAGTPAAVAQAPALKRTLVAGQSFSANTSYAVRWGITANGETSNQVYAADITTSSFDEFYVIGMASSATAVSAGQSIVVTTAGSFSLSSSDSAFGAGTDGLAVFLTASGTFSTTPPSSSGQAVTRIGIVSKRSASVASNVIDVWPVFVGVC